MARTVRTAAMLAGFMTLLWACQQPGRNSKTFTREELVMASVVDEASAMAWSGQFEGQALTFLMNKAPSGTETRAATPGYEQLRSEPGRWRGSWIRFCGKLVALRPAPGTGHAESGRMLQGLLLLEDGALTTFLITAPESAAPALETGKALEVQGRFLKRWVALDAGGDDYLVMPALAAQSVRELSGETADRLARMQLGKGLLPLKHIEAPEVWSRPVVELGRNGALYLNGRLVTMKALDEEIGILAARDRNPLGDSALAVVIIADERAPAISRTKLRELPGKHGAKCIFRPAHKKAGNR